MKKRPLVLIFCLLITTGSALGDTWGRMLEQIRYDIGDVTSTITTDDYRWPTSVLLRRANEVQDRIARETLCISSRTFIEGVTDYALYTLPADCIKIKRIVFQQTSSTTSYKKIEHWTIGGLDKNPTWENRNAGIPKKYVRREGNQIELTPRVGAAYARLEAIKIDYYKDPVDMGGTASEPWEGLYHLQSYSDLIVMGVTIKCLYAEGKPVAAMKAELDAMIRRMYDEIHKQEDPIQGGIDY
jgi:hypothetical protein